MGTFNSSDDISITIRIHVVRPNTEPAEMVLGPFSFSSGTENLPKITATADTSHAKTEVSINTEGKTNDKSKSSESTHYISGFPRESPIMITLPIGTEPIMLTNRGFSQNLEKVVRTESKITIDDSVKDHTSATCNEVTPKEEVPVSSSEVEDKELSPDSVIFQPVLTSKTPIASILNNTSENQKASCPTSIEDDPTNTAPIADLSSKKVTIAPVPQAQAGKDTVTEAISNYGANVDDTVLAECRRAVFEAQVKKMTERALEYAKYEQEESEGVAEPLTKAERLFADFTEEVMAQMREESGLKPTRIIKIQPDKFNAYLVHAKPDMKKGSAEHSDVQELEVKEVHSDKEDVGKPQTDIANEKGDRLGSAQVDNACTKKAHVNEAQVIKSQLDKSKAYKVQTSEAQTAEAQAAEAQSAEAQSAEAQSAEAQSVEAQSVEAQSVGAQTAEAQTAKAQTAKAQTAKAQIAEGQTGEAQTAEARTDEFAS